MADHPQSAKGICPSCGKKGSKEFRKDLLSLVEHTHELPTPDEGEVGAGSEIETGVDAETDVDVIQPTMTVPDDSELTQSLIGDTPESPVVEEIKEAQDAKELEHPPETKKPDAEDKPKVISGNEEPTRIISHVAPHPIVGKFSLKEDLTRFARVCNLIQDLSDNLENMRYTIQFHVEGANSFYFRIRDGQIQGFSGTLSGTPDVSSDVISLQEAQYVLQGNPNADLSYLHARDDDTEDLVDHFLRIHELFDIIVHA